jgi:hypothetical protein
VIVSPADFAANLEQLCQEMASFTINALAKSSLRNYGAYVRYCLEFCSLYGCRARSPTDATLMLYVTHLARRCAYRTIKTYFTGVQVLHLERGLSNPVQGNFNLDRLLHGIKRAKGDLSPNRKLAMTPQIFFTIISRLDLFDSRNAAFVAAMLVGFFCFFRKANLVPSRTVFNPMDDLSPVRGMDFDLLRICANCLGQS